MSTDELGSARDDPAAHETRADTMSGTVTPAPLAARNDAAGAADAAAVAGDLQAARESLQRNDLVAAQAQLNAVEPEHEDDSQVRALQREVEARANAAALDGSAPPRKPKQARTPSSTLTKSTRAHERHENRLASQQHSGHMASDAQRRHESQTVTVENSTGDSGSIVAQKPAGTSNAPTQSVAPASALPAVPAAQVAAPVPAPPVVSQAAHETVQPASQSASQPASQHATQPAAAPPALERAQQAAPQTLPTAQVAPRAPLTATASSTGTQISADSGPKTRAQVREEIVRARSDGSLPAFGNPDPAGPGGAPSMSLAPRP
ncbi:hypothetical protein AAGS40_19095 [Paraburkholderia sp. PREW-6R]|uniref:hypothetical protein n=1 Tax=Paraburkholderia sp. PREW-6R TaxID=3141544 RepID=UPI0031F49D2D